MSSRERDERARLLNEKLTAWGLRDVELRDSLRIPNPLLRRPSEGPTLNERLEQERDEARRKWSEALEDNEDLKRELAEREREIRLLMLEQERLRVEVRSRAYGGNIEPSQVSDLIRLCHPDRHQPGLAPLANRITAWLLTLRRT